CSPTQACPPTRMRSPISSAVTTPHGKPTSTWARNSSRIPTRPGSTAPSPSSRAWSISSMLPMPMLAAVTRSTWRPTRRCMSCMTKCSRPPSTMASRPAWSNGPRTGTRHSRTTGSPPCCARRNWSRSFVAVPASGAETEEAKELAAWLTAPEQQTEAFENAGTFPSQLEAQASDEVQSATNPFFNDAPVGKIFSDRAKAIDGVPFKGANYFAIHQAVADAILRVDVSGEQDPDASWQGAVEEFNSLGLM